MGDQKESLRKFFQKFQLHDGGLNSAVSQAFNALDSTSPILKSLKDVKNPVKKLSTSAKIDLFHLAHEDPTAFQKVLSEENIRAIEKLDNAFDRKHTPRPYPDKTLLVMPVYKQLYMILPSLSALEKAHLSNLRDDIKSLKHGDVQSAFLGGLSYAKAAGKDDALQYFITGEAIKDANDHQKSWKTTDAKTNLFFALSQFGKQEREKFLKVGDGIANWKSGDEQAYFLKNLADASDWEKQEILDALEYSPSTVSLDPSSKRIIIKEREPELPERENNKANDTVAPHKEMLYGYNAYNSVNSNTNPKFSRKEMINLVIFSSKNKHPTSIGSNNSRKSREGR